MLVLFSRKINQNSTGAKLLIVFQIQENKCCSFITLDLIHFCISNFISCHALWMHQLRFWCFSPNNLYKYNIAQVQTEIINHTHIHAHARTHARMHTHTHVGFYGLRGLSIGVMVFILYKLYVLLPYTYPTPKLSPHRRLMGTLKMSS